MDLFEHDQIPLSSLLHHAPIATRPKGRALGSHHLLLLLVVTATTTFKKLASTMKALGGATQILRLLLDSAPSLKTGRDLPGYRLRVVKRCCCCEEIAVSIVVGLVEDAEGSLDADSASPTERFSDPWQVLPISRTDSKRVSRLIAGVGRGGDQATTRLELDAAAASCTTRLCFFHTFMSTQQLGRCMVGSVAERSRFMLLLLIWSRWRRRARSHQPIVLRGSLSRRRAFSGGELRVFASLL